jgi:hypothetical protein
MTPLITYGFALGIDIGPALVWNTGNAPAGFGLSLRAYSAAQLMVAVASRVDTSLVGVNVLPLAAVALFWLHGASVVQDGSAAARS